MNDPMIVGNITLTMGRYINPNSQAVIFRQMRQPHSNSRHIEYYYQTGCNYKQ